MIMNQSASDNKRLVKNTVLLYIRTFFVLCIGLYTSRLILISLGVSNYGIFNIVGGLVSLFSIVSSTLVATTQRFLNFELGKGESGNPQLYFSVSFSIHVLLAIVLLFLFETVGLYFLNFQLNIPPDRMVAANWVFQCSVLSFLINIISTPYTAVLIAHEKMSAFAYISLLESVLKLFIVYCLYSFSYDALIVYSVLLLLVSISVGSLYVFISKRSFVETALIKVTDTSVYKSIFKFTSMNFIGTFASILSSQGVDVILNLFFGITANAARGVANQVQNASSKFVNDFMTALNPQITKEYAAMNFEKSKELCFRGSKFAFFLMLLLATPIIIRAPYILELWLDVVPEYSIEFVRLGLIFSLVSLLSNSFVTEILATGNLTVTTYWIGGVRLLILPVIYCMFKFTSCEPICAYVILILMETVSLMIRLIVLEYITNMKFVCDFLKYVLTRVLCVSMVSIFIVLQLDSIIEMDFLGLILFGIESIVVVGGSIYLLGLSTEERRSMLVFINSKINKK